MMELNRHPGSLLLSVITAVRRKITLPSWSFSMKGDTEIKHQFD